MWIENLPPKCPLAGIFYLPSSAVNRTISSRVSNARSIVCSDTYSET